MAPAARDHGTPPVAAALPGGMVGTATASLLIPGSSEHQRIRWKQYQQDKAGDPKAWPYPRWEKQYRVNMRNAIHGLAREKEYRKALGGESKTLKTPFTFRQIDIYRGDEKYCGQLKTGKMGLSKQARTQDIPKDAALVALNYEVEYFLEKGGSKPFLKALDAAGITYKIGPQIP